MKVLIATQGHGLLPFAWRLKKEGADVRVVVWKDRYERAWEGMFDKALTGTQKNKDSLSALVEEAKSGEVVVLADSPRGMTVFSECPKLFGVLPPKVRPPPRKVMLGGWFDGEKFSPGLGHLLVHNIGLWPGGLGPEIVSGLVLMRSSDFNEHLEPLEINLRERNFRGLVRVGVSERDDGHMLPDEPLLGWGDLQAHAFLGELSSFSSLLAGHGDIELLRKKYVVVSQFSVPPYPICSTSPAKHLQVGGLSDEDTSNIFFHDFMVKDKEVWTAGLDGLVGVARGSSEHLELAILRCREILSKVQLPEKQVRMDVGYEAALAVGLLQETHALDGLESTNPEPGLSYEDLARLPIAS